MRSKLILVVLGSVAYSGCATDDLSQTADEVNGIRYGVDYAWARPSPAHLHAEGYSFAARYLSHDTSGKNLSHGEADQLIANQVDVVVVWETTSDRALSGYSGGAADATDAAQQAAGDGMPGSRPIYFAIDFDASESQQATLNSYFDGVASVIGRDRTGAYGGYYPIARLFNAGKIAWGWQTYAWSGGQWDSRAQVRQIENGIEGGGLDKDEAVADDFGQWGVTGGDEGPAPTAPPVPTSCGAIEPGHGLSNGQAWSSCDGRFTLAMQGDGNLVLYSLGFPLWATSTNNNGAIVVMQGDGNLVEYSHHSHPLFASGTSGHGGARLAIQDDGNLVVYAGATALWASRTAGMPPAPTACGLIDPGHGLALGESISSCDGRYVLAMQGDGNLVLYHGGSALWASQTSGTDGRRAVMQGDGNLVVYGETAALWASRTSGDAGGYLAVQDDGNVVIYVGGHPVWSTGTNGQ
jgi:hypothetical protein